MQHSDFQIGLEFLASGGFRWRCTDVGSRTITAIRLSHQDPSWYAGPPYVIKEVVFDEHEIPHCHLTTADAATASARNHRESGHPGYSNDAVGAMLEARHGDPANRYPNRGLLRFDRVRPDGEILHPYAARKEDGAWVILLYLPFVDAFIWLWT